MHLAQVRLEHDLTTPRAHAHARHIPLQVRSPHTLMRTVIAAVRRAPANSPPSHGTERNPAEPRPEQDHRRKPHTRRENRFDGYRRRPDRKKLGFADRLVVCFVVRWLAGAVWSWGGRGGGRSGSPDCRGRGCRCWGGSPWGGRRGVVGAGCHPGGWGGAGGTDANPHWMLRRARVARDSRAAARQIWQDLAALPVARAGRWSLWSLAGLAGRLAWVSAGRQVVVTAGERRRSLPATTSVTKIIDVSMISCPDLGLAVGPCVLRGRRWCRRSGAARTTGLVLSGSGPGRRAPGSERATAAVSSRSQCDPLRGDLSSVACVAAVRPV